jgi:uncharacterized protein (DUF486 family)
LLNKVIIRLLACTAAGGPANRIGNTQYSLAQLKIMQEVTLSVFVPFAMLYMDQPFKLDYVRAVYFIFRS